MKIVINKQYGGFELSERAYERLLELGVPRCPYDNECRDGFIADMEHPESIKDNLTASLRKMAGRYYANWLRDDKGRTNDLLVQVVEELGDAANGPHAKLKVVEVPNDISWEIDEYDGMERIRETARSWG